jgi:hypothetical protein
MSRFFNKIHSIGNNIFSKAQSASSHFFNKTIPTISQGLDYVSDKAREYGRKVGNTLEKNVGNIADYTSSALAMMGKPQYATMASSIGNIARSLGSNVKKSGRAISNVSNDLNDSIIRNANPLQGSGLIL